MEIDKWDIVDNYPLLLKQDNNVVSNMVLYMDDKDFVSNVLKLTRRTRTIFRNFLNLSNATLYSHLFNPLATEVQFIRGSVFIPLPLVNSFVTDTDVNDLQKIEVFSKLGFLIGQALKWRTLLDIPVDSNVVRHFDDYLLTESPIRYFKNGDLDLAFGSTNMSMKSRLADDSSLRLTYDTYQKFTFDDVAFLNTDNFLSKSYFLGVAQKFCKLPESAHELAIAMYSTPKLPNHFRVNNMMMNSVAFKDTFACPIGSVMNPVLKNQQFPFLEDIDGDEF